MYYLFVLGHMLALSLPRGVCYSVAKFFSVLHFYISKKDRQAVFYNLSVITENKKVVKEQAKQVFINFSYYLVDFFRNRKLNSDFINKYVKISGAENVDRALAQGKGAIALGAHIGNYEMAGAITSFLGYPLTVVALPHKDKRLNSFFDSRRQASGMEVIPTGVAVKGCIRALRKQRLVGLLGDRDFSNKGLKVKMLSKYAYVPRGIAFFVLKTGAPIVPIFLTREKNRKFYRLVFGEPIINKENSPVSEKSIINSYIRVLEKYIKKYPGQWYMFRKYWVNGANG